MRTTAHKTQNRPAPKQATHGRVQLKAPPGAGNRFRADNFERQADDFASRVLAGETGLSGRITPTSPAGFTLPTSSGRPLDSDLKEELEKSFGADLSAVRIHSDSEAAGAAEDYGARAFTSGRDIFFAGGRFQPQTREGKLLLAHELTHVLQQTGRVSEKGALKATNRRGHRFVQLEAAIPDLPTLRKLHAPKKKDKTKFEEIAGELAKRVATPDPGAALEAYFNESLANIKDWPPEAESLLFDTLKHHEKFALASQLIERDDFKGGARISTAAWTGAFVSVLEGRNKGEEVFVRAAEKHPVLAWYVEEWLRLIEVFIFQPVRARIPLLNRYGVKEDETTPQTIDDHLSDLSKRLDDNTKLSSSEWVYNGLLKLSRLNDVRIKQCLEINHKAVEQSNKTKEHAIFVKRRYAEGVRDWGAKFLESTGEVFKDSTGTIKASAKSAWDPFLKKLGTRVQKIGASALETWDRKEAIEKTFFEFHETRDKGDAKALAEVTKKLRQVKTAGEATGLPNELIHLVRELNRRGKGGESPAPADEFSSRAEALVMRLTEFSENKLEKPQAKLFHDKTTDDEVAYIWLTVWLQELISNLRWVASSTAAGLNVELIDQRIRQRLHFARRSLWLARALQWEKVIEEADKVIFAKEEKTDQLAILPYDDGKFWHHDKTVPIEDLSKLKSIRSWEPITGTHLALLYRKAYYESVAAKIKQITPTTDAEEKLWVEASGMIPFIAATADKEVRKLPFPEFWTVKSYDFAIKEFSKTPFDSLIQSHHSFGEITDHGSKASLSWILPVEPAKPFAWFIPKINTVLPTLRGIDLLNAQVAIEVEGKDAEKKLEKAKQLDGDTWLKLLSQSITKQIKNEKMTKEELQTLQAGVQTALEGEQAQAWKQLLVQIKRGSRVDRQIIARWSIEHLDKYANRDTRRHDQPLKALEPIIRFFVAVSMLEDQDIEAEMTALMLEIAPNLEAAFSRESRFDVVHSYLGWLESAVKFLPTFQAMTVQQRHVFLPDYENKSDWLEPRIASLTSITEHFKSVRESVQRKSGYKTSATDQTFKVFMAYSSSLPAGLILYPREGQSILGEPKSTHYQVTKIYKDFVYHPAYGFGGGGGGEETQKGKPKKKKAAATGYSEAKFLELDDKTPLALAKDEKLLEVRILNSKNQEVAVKQVGPEDAEILADVHNGLAWAAFGSAMGNIQAGIEWYVNTMLDVAEFIPGVGQGIAAARILATIAEFWADGDYNQIKSIVAGGLREIVEGLHQRIKDSADPENLIQLLLFGDPRLDELLAHSSIGKGKTPDAVVGADTGKFAKAKKAIDAFRRLGRSLFKAIRKLHDGVQVPMDDFHTYAATRPVLALALNFIADNIFTIASIATTFYDIGTKEDRPKGVVQELKDTLKEQQDDFGNRFHAILKQFEELELPETVMDISPIIASVLTILEEFLIKRLGLKARVGFFLLQKTGALDFFNERVADEIVAAGVDPNIYWKEQIVPEIAGKFNETRDTVVTEINKLTGSKAFGGIFKQIPKAEKVTLTTEGEPFEETKESYIEPAPAAANTNPYPSLDRPLRVRPRNVPAHGPGQPLTPELLQRGESVLGRSLKHVRLHTGAESAEMTDTFGADALTTGSHIFMRPGLSAQSGRGAKVFQHELVHVLQQTGKRRRGSDSSQPIPGRPEMGLDYDPARERIADQVAESAGRLATQPNFDEQKDTGLQPSGINLFTIHKLLRTITDLPDIKQRQELLDKLKKEAKLPTRVKAAVENTLSVLTHLQSNTSILKYPDVFKSAIKLIDTRLGSSIYADPMRIAAFAIAKQALMDLPVPKPVKGTKSKAATSIDQVLKPVHFARQLEGYILAKTGIVLALTFNETKVKAPSGEDVETIDDTKPVKEIKILNIYLPYIDGRSPLWVEAIKNTWRGADEKKLTKIRIQARALFERKGIVVGVWALFGIDYQFSYGFRKDVNDLVNASITGSTLDPKDLTAWKDYVETNRDSASPIGLRLASYGHPSQKAAGRESHHLTQFLLADYFSSSTSNKHRPFKKSRSHPGLTWEGDEVKFIGQKPGATAKDNSIFVGETKGPSSTRGKVMPTISLAASTHKSGRLHITPEADDIAGSATSSQASAVNNEFERHMPAELLGNEQTFKDYRKQHSDDAIAAVTYRATQRTYKEIERRMSEALHARMPLLELEYYKEMAIGTPHDISDKTNPDVKTKDEIEFREKLEKIPPLAKEHNKAGMLELGWNLEKV